MTVPIVKSGWAQMFAQMRRPSRFLQRFFSVKPGGIFSGDKVAIDVERFGESVAVVVEKYTGANMNRFDQFTTKEFTPPAYNEGFSLNVAELVNRMVGVDPYSAAYQSDAAQFVTSVAKGMALTYDKIVRAIELQAAQVLQTGTLSLTDADGNTRFTLDFSPKAAHFPTSSTTWGQTGDDKIGDLITVCDLVSSNGQVQPTDVILASGPMRELKKDDEVQKALDNRSYTMGEIAPQFVNSGAIFHGYLWVGNYRLRLWSYDGRYDDPATGASTNYLNSGSAIVLSESTRLDLVSARCPMPIAPDPRVSSLMPGRLSSVAEGYDVTPNVYATPNGKALVGELEARPLCVPVQIDGFACLDTGL
jgi:hypothetical protein